MQREPDLPAQGKLRIPRKGDLHLWFVQIGSEDGTACEPEILSHEERERADRFRNHGSRLRFIGARASLRRLLSAYLDLAPVRIPLELEPEGKPVLGEGLAPLLSFNLSHSGDWALLGFASGATVGVDLEAQLPFRDILGVAARVLAVDEVASLRQLPPDRLESAFFRAWVRKEALLKARGVGIWTSPSQFAAGLGRSESGPDVTVVRDTSSPRSWAVQNVEAPVGYVAAAAMEGRDLCVHTFGFAPHR